MTRRLLVENLSPGTVALPAEQAHHARDVLRLRQGETVELFTADGKTALATLASITPQQVLAEVERIEAPAGPAVELTIASAIPKGARADWLIEKLSELGTARFIPLRSDRSVVHPEGASKLQRWKRLAAEAAKQSRRVGVMRIEGLMPLEDVVEQAMPGTMIAPLTPSAARPLLSILDRSSAVLLLIGPEGGWSEAELEMFQKRHLTALTLGATILRVETAALAAAAVVAARSAADRARSNSGDLRLS